MIVVAPVIIVEKIGEIFNIFSGFFFVLIEAFIIVALTEEYFKRVVVMKIAYKNNEFDERLDGIVYCVVASLGFATIENIGYVLNYWTQDSSLWIFRALLSVPVHMLLGVTMGYYLALSKFCTNKALSKKFYKKSLIIPMLFHGLYDFLIMMNTGVLAFFVFPFMIYFWISNMKKLKTYYKESKLSNSA